MNFPPRILAIDIETNGLNPYDPETKAGVISWYGHNSKKEITEGCYSIQAMPSALRKPLKDKDTLKLFFNAKFDIVCLQKAQVAIEGPVFDISIMLRLLYPDELRYTLKHFTRKILSDIYNEELVLKEFIGRNRLTKQVKTSGYVGIVPDHILFPYCQADSRNTYNLFSHVVDLLTERKMWPTAKMETRLLPGLIDMERTGIEVDKEYARNLLVEAQNRLRALTVSMQKVVGDKEFNPGSSLQVGEYLKQITSQWTITGTGKVATDKAALLSLASETPFVLRIIEYRKLSKAASTYIKNVLEATKGSEVFRVSFNQMGALTGRFSSSGYGIRGQLQNIPRPGKGVLGRIRNIFVARNKCRFIFFDYDQIEMRLRAHFSKDTKLIEAINRNEDIHTRTALEIIGKTKFDENPKLYRQIFKTINYAVQYGVGAIKLQSTILQGSGGEIKLTYEECADYLGSYKDLNPYLLALFGEIEEQVMLTGGITNPFGRFILVDQAKAYIGLNYLIQSTVADLIKRKMLQIWNEMKNWKLGGNVKMILQIHDELVFELTEQTGNWVVTKIKQIMEERSMFSIPITVSISEGKRWGEKRKLQLF